MADVDNQQLCRGQLAQLEVQLGVSLFEYIKRGHQKRTRAASRVADADAGQLALPCQPKSVFSDVARRYRFWRVGAFFFAGLAPAAFKVILVLQLKKPLDDGGLHGLLDDKAGDVVGCVDHTIALAFALDVSFALFAVGVGGSCQGEA